METLLNASATSAGALFSNSLFVVPPFQREYAWTNDEVEDFWSDLRSGIDDASYFLGLIILTDEGKRKHVVDGQQRLLTMTLLASAIYHEAMRAQRRALADRIKADFLSAIDYQTDETQPRVVLSDDMDDAMFQAILQDRDPIDVSDEPDGEVLSPRLWAAYLYLRGKLQKDIADDPFKRLGVWTEFLTKNVYFAVFVHPDPASAYRVFEVVNTRGKELTTADLLKNWVISQTAPQDRSSRYEEWKQISRSIESTANGSLVQFIRHVVSLDAGYVLPRDLFDYVSGRLRTSGTDRRTPPSVPELMQKLSLWAPQYLQLIDPTLGGPAEPEWLDVYTSLDELNVLSVRPVIMALTTAQDPTEGMRALLRLVVRRIVVGNLGTGNVERRFSEAARKIAISGDWQDALRELDDLNPARWDFVEQLRKRSLNKGSLTFLRRSLVQRSITPDAVGFFHLVRPRQAPDWKGFPDDDFTYWGSTLGNTFLANVERRPRPSSTWPDFKENLLPEAIDGDPLVAADGAEDWTSDDVARTGAELAESLADVWY